MGGVTAARAAQAVRTGASATKAAIELVNQRNAYLNEIESSGSDNQCDSSKGGGSSGIPDPDDEEKDESEASKNGLDWDAVVPKKGKYKGQSRPDQVRLHIVDNPGKPQHGVFYGDGVDITNQAWDRAKKLGLKPDSNGTLKVPMNKVVGRSGGQAADAGELFYNVEIKVVPGTNKIITSYPTN